MVASLQPQWNNNGKEIGIDFICLLYFGSKFGNIRGLCDREQLGSFAKERKMSTPSVLFVCLGNICRSPTAEGVFAQKVKERGLSIEIDSAGTAGYHHGAAPDKRSQDVAAKRGYNLSKLKCRKVVEADFAKFDHIIAMDKANVKDLKRKCPEEYQHKISLFLNYASAEFDEVPDPYYGGKRGFELVLDLIEDASDGFIAKLTS